VGTSASLALPAATLPADPVERAIRAIGGRALIERVRAIRWTGMAKVLAGGRTIDLGVETSVEPFVRAQSDSWPASQGRGEMRSLRIEGGQGFKVIKGVQSALSQAATINERQQFGIYGYMLMVGARWETMPHGTLRGSRPGFPPIDISFGEDSRILSADYAVSPPDDSAVRSVPIHEHFRFAGMVSDKGVRWPKRLSIAQDGEPFFTLSIDHFAVDLH
jgi:hypothetical protein